MNKINELITNYKNIFLLIILVVIGLLFWIYILPYLTSKTENLENISVNDISKLIDQDVYVKCNIDELDNKNNKITNVYYLAIAQKKSCINLQSIIDNECQYNIPILIKQKNKFGLFNFSKHPSLDKYTIRSKVNEFNAPNLTQNLNLYRNKNLLCFDNDKDDETIYFEIDQISSGFILKFKKKIKNIQEQQQEQDYYVGICDDFDPTCNQGPDKLKRICLYIEQAKATIFQFEMHPKQEQEQEHTEEHTQEYTEEHTQEHKQEHMTESFGNVESMRSIYSFASNDSDRTLLSLPGAGNIEDSNMEDFKPWI